MQYGTALIQTSITRKVLGRLTKLALDSTVRCRQVARLGLNIVQPVNGENGENGDVHG